MVQLLIRSKQLYSKPFEKRISYHQGKTTSFCRLCIKLMLNKAETWKLYSWTRPIIAILSGQLWARTAKSHLKYQQLTQLKACVFWKMTYHWMCRLLFRSVCLQTTSSAGMALEGVERNYTLAVTAALRMAANSQQRLSQFKLLEFPSWAKCRFCFETWFNIIFFKLLFNS